METYFDTLGNVIRRFPEIACGTYHDATKVFVKINRENNFDVEVAGLNALRKSKAIRIANVVGYGRSNLGEHALVLEAITSTSPTADFYHGFGSSLAKMHKSSTDKCYGFEHDNFLGHTKQLNSWNEDWIEFFSLRRLGFQLQLAKSNGLGGSKLQELGLAVRDNLGEILGPSPEPPCLIHGDLWSGNWICDENGCPALIDPAVYFANREAEFGMTTLFGGLPESFYQSYNDTWPMADGWRQRVEIYRLYHVLNHLNLFGESYLGQALRILRKFV